MLDPHIVQLAWQQARRQGVALDAVMATQTGLAPADCLTQLGQVFHFPTCRLLAGDHLVPDLSTLGLPDCRRLSALVLTRLGQRVLLLANPTDEALQRWADAKGIAVDLRELVLESELLDLLARLEAATSALPGILDHGFTEVARQSGLEEISLSRIDETASPVVRLINSTLFDAMGAGASDIHLEAAASGLVVKYRIDGVIVEAGRVPGAELNEQAISRVKVMAELDITERRTPQDGRFRVRIRERDIDFRVSIMPSVYGEDAVIRILDKEHLSDQLAGLTLNHLGFDAAPMAVIRSLASKPHGMLLITGPTGSGKTTTLYAAISEINDGASKIITIEDPVEYQVPGVLQI
ncbi:MAG: ATPase, T2SS/T4P/T4SS family, partial [Rhodoferax sp.]|nr:ATPase, T2SS/T4P/T4SS family [Rhodoferax sp.]